MIPQRDRQEAPDFSFTQNSVTGQPMSVLGRLSSGLEIELSDMQDWFLLMEIFVNREYEIGINHALRYLHLEGNYEIPENFNVLDVGCNVGYFTLYAANELLLRCRPFSIYAVDGSQRCIETYLRRMRQQPEKLLVDKIGWVWGLVGGQKTGASQFSESNFHSMNHMGTWTHEHGGTKRTYVPYTNLDALFTSENIHLLKVDIEGSEQAFIETYDNLLRRTYTLIIEFHHALVDVEKCRTVLSRLGLHQIHNKPKGNCSLEVFSRI